MQIIIYESSAFGGCYEYSKQLFAAYTNHSLASSCKLLLPSNAMFAETGVHRILLRDRVDYQWKAIKKIHFLLKNLLQPFQLFFFLLKEKKSFVLLNDFEQITAIFWVPFFKLFLRKHRFGIFLHDPDRDSYPPAKLFSFLSMKTLMSLIDIAFYHEHLPDKSYYSNTHKCRYISVPHGIYPNPKPDKQLLEWLKSQKDNCQFFSMLGNIRPEKNYELAIRAMKDLPNVKLLIAGLPANSGISLDYYKQLAEKEGVSDKILWYEKFYSGAQQSALIEASEVVLLYYAQTFTSQSAILSSIAPFCKKILVSDGNSSLAKTVKTYDLGMLVAPDNLDELKLAFRQISKSENRWKDNWHKYLQYASWKNHVDIAMSEIENFI